MLVYVDDNAYASTALPQPDTELELVAAAAADVVVDDWAAARPATPRRSAAEKRIIAADMLRCSIRLNSFVKGY